MLLTHRTLGIYRGFPIFLNPSGLPGLGLRKPLTGHIDIVQVRTDGVWVLDYKPNLNDPKKFSSQMLLYREALQRRTSIPISNIHIAAFNEHGFYRFEEPKHVHQG